MLRLEFALASYARFFAPSQGEEEDTSSNTVTSYFRKQPRISIHPNKKHKVTTIHNSTSAVIYPFIIQFKHSESSFLEDIQRTSEGLVQLHEKEEDLEEVQQNPNLFSVGAHSLQNQLHLT